MSVKDMLKMMFTPAPGLKKQVEKEGKHALAVVKCDPGNISQGISYQGRDEWLDIDVEVKPDDNLPFEGKMKCQLSASMALTRGMTVNIRYDPRDKSKILLMDDVSQLFYSQVIQP
jgi:hypothetical protein